jgi:hypothetical protein
MVRSTIVIDVIGDLLPLYLSKALLLAQCLVMIRVDAVEVLLDELVEEINPLKCQL